MSLLNRLFGREEKRLLQIRDGMFVIRSVDFASKIKQTRQPNFYGEDVQICSPCNEPMREIVITTGGPHGDPAVWREHPITVDGWICTRCGELRYPRKLAAERMTEFGRQGSNASSGETIR